MSKTNQEDDSMTLLEFIDDLYTNVRYKIGCGGIGLFFFVLLIVFAKLNQEEMPPVNECPDTLMYKAEKVLARNWFAMLMIMDKVKAHHFDGVLYHFSAIKQHDFYLNKDGVLKDIIKMNQVLDSNIHDIFAKKQTFFNFTCDSDLYLFYDFDNFDNRYLSALCYSELSFDQLKNRSFGMDVYPHDSVPKKKDSFFWEIEKNWYIYEPKKIYFNDSTYQIRPTYQWAMTNKEKFFYQTYDTLTLIKDEFKRIFSNDTDKVIVNAFIRNVWSTRYFYENVFDGDYNIFLDNMNQGLWRVATSKGQWLLYTKTRLLDSLYADVNDQYPFEFFYNSNYLKVNVTNNYYLKYVYSELPQVFLEQVFDSKLHRLKDNWYYIDFECSK